MNKKQCLLILSKKQYAEFVIKGKTFKYNQLVANGNFVNSSNWDNFGGTLSVSNNEGTLTITSSASSNRLQCNATIQSGHKYILSFYANCDKTTHMFLLVNSVSIANDILITQNLKEQHSIIFTATESGTLPIRFYCNKDGTYLQNGDKFILSKVLIIDLTDLGLDSISTISDFYNTDIGKAIQNGFYFSTSKNCAIYNATTPFNFINKIFAPTTDFELRGINSAQDIYHNATGEITRKIGVVDLGSLTWFSENDNWYGQVPNAKGKFGENGQTQICARYKNATDLDADMTCRFGYTSININIHDVSLIGLTGEQVAQALSGELLYYELDSDTTASAESVSLKKSTNKCYDKNGLELDII